MSAVSDDRRETVMIQLGDGSETPCDIVSIFPVQHLNRQFIALNPLYDTDFGSADEIQLFSLAPLDGVNRFELAVIEESIFSLVSDEFFRIIES